MTGYDEERIGELLRLLPEPPQAWVQAAQELPQARAEIDQIVARAEQDAEFRSRLVADLEAALRRRVTRRVPPFSPTSGSA